MTRRDRAFLMMCLFGFVFVCSLFWIYRTWRWEANTTAAPGKVLEHRLISSSRGRDSYGEVIDYNAADGHVSRFMSAGSSDPLPIGTAVVVRYDPENPKDAEIDSFAKVWAGPLG